VEFTLAFQMAEFGLNLRDQSWTEPRRWDYMAILIPSIWKIRSGFFFPTATRFPHNVAFSFSSKICAISFRTFA